MHCNAKTETNMRILFSIIGCLLAVGATAQEVSQQRFIKLTYVPNRAYVEQATETIEAVSAVPSETTVEYRAGRSILLHPGFIASQGAIFTAHIRPVTETKLHLTAFPNPFDRGTTIDFSLPEAGTVNLTIVDATGRVVGQLLENSQQTAGRHQIEWGAEALPPGVYIPILNINQQQVSNRLIKK